jgi:hypothetical protein
MLNRIVALIWMGAALAVGFMALKIAFGPKGDASGWVLAAVFATAAAFCAWQGWRDWRAADAKRPPAPAAGGGPRIEPQPRQVGADPAPLETQIANLAAAGLALAPGRTLEELLQSFPREDYEADPYNLLLFMYGSEVEAEPWGRVFCERGWTFDMECLSGAGDYARAFEPVLRTTGRPEVVTDLTDDFRIDAETAQIRYVLKGQPREITARVDNDWADPQAVTAFLRDIESAVGDDRRFWAADNGQASVLFFITDAEAAAINELRPDTLMRYVET